MNFIKIILIIFSYALFGCSEEIEYETKNAGMSAVEGSINWLDNERVIYVNKDTPDSGKIYIWNTVTGKKELYAPEATGGICYSEGYISYQVKRTDNYRVMHLMQGEFGDEKELIYDWRDKDQEKYKESRYSCKRFIPPSEHKDRLISYLREDHGYIDKGVKRIDEYTNPVYVRKDDKRFELPIKSTHYQFPSDFYQFKKAYFIWQTISSYEPWKRLGCVSGLWLYPTGDMKLVCVPYRDDFRYGAIQVFPIKVGYLVVVHKNDARDKERKSGIYYLDKNLNFNEKILTGNASDITISNNGCNVAFAYKDNALVGSKLQMIKMCNKI